MKLYLIAPVVPANMDKQAATERLRACIEPIAELIFAHVANDPALFGVRHEGEVSDAPVKPDMHFDYAQAVRLADGNELLKVLLASGDPYNGKWMLVRSLVTCRAVSYGYDGEAFVCLPSDAPQLLSPDETLISVEDCSHLLGESDWMDGINAN